MSWRDQYKPASYRGVPFFVRSDDSERSQRIAKHLFPARNRANLEELGLNPDSFTLECFVLGDNCFDLRDNLHAACMKPGSGKLVHPFYGEMLVKCERVKTRHEDGEQGVVRFSIEFTRDDDLAAIEKAVDTQARVLRNASDILNDQKTTFDDLFDFVSLPYAKAQSVLDQVNQSVDSIEKARALVNQSALFSRTLSNIRGAMTALVLDAELLAGNFIEVITFGFLTPDPNAGELPDTKPSFTGLSSLFGFSPIIASSSSASDAINQLIRGAALAQAAHLLSITDFTSVEEAEEFRDILFSGIDSYLSITALDDDLYLKMQEIRASAEADISARALVLPRLVEISLPEFTPALVLSYRLYGTVNEEETILERNKVEHPGIVPASTPIKVLTDV